MENSSNCRLKRLELIDTIIKTGDLQRKLELIDTIIKTGDLQRKFYNKIFKYTKLMMKKKSS